MIATIVLVLLLQAAVMGFDEFYFHRRRGLPRWERIGHPIDTAVVLGCFAFTLALPFSASTLRIYAGLSLFSCALISKDEWIHARLCRPGELWLHSVLFILHPLVLIGAGLLWSLSAEELNPATAKRILQLEAFLLAAYLLYQSVYWNFIWKQPQNVPADQR